MANQLPSRPNLDHLRRQAKQLLSQLNEGAPLTDKDARGWQDLFRTAQGLTARFTTAHLVVRGGSATAAVQALYKFVPAAGGSQRELRPKMAMRFTKTSNGWRIADMRELP